MPRAAELDRFDQVIQRLKIGMDHDRMVAPGLSKHLTPCRAVSVGAELEAHYFDGLVVNITDGKRNFTWPATLMTRYGEASLVRNVLEQLVSGGITNDAQA